MELVLAIKWMEKRDAVKFYMIQATVNTRIGAIAAVAKGVACRHKRDRQGKGDRWALRTFYAASVHGTMTSCVTTQSTSKYYFAVGSTCQNTCFSVYAMIS